MGERYYPVPFGDNRALQGYDPEGRFVGLSVEVTAKIADPRVVRIKSGWVGQVIFRDEIVKEEQAFETAEEAHTWAVEEIDNAVRNLFA